MKVKLLASSCALLWATYAYGGAAPGPLQALIDDALQRNPTLKAAASRHQAASQRPVQEGALPDPQAAMTQFLRTPETRVGPQLTMLSVSQRFPWKSKLEAQSQVAEKAAEVAGAVVGIDRDEIVRQVTVAYWDLAFVDRAADIAEEDLELLRHFETLAQARYSQGVGSQLAAIKLQADITRGLNRLQQLRRRRADVEAKLNALRDRDPQTALPRVELEDRDIGELNLPSLYAAARKARPELSVAMLQTETEEKRLDLARKQGKPDITVGAGYTFVTGRRDAMGRESPPMGNGKDVYSLTVGVSLPIFRRKYDAGVEQATANILAAKQSYRAIWNQAQAGIRSSAFDIEVIQGQIDLFQNTLLPQAMEALRSSEQSYASGGAGVLDLVDSERTLIEVRLGLAQLRADRLKSIADLERAIGGPLAEVMQ